MTVEHALCCKVGGLVHIRHDDVADEWHHLCGCALSFGCVKREPQIYSSVSHQQRLDASSDTPSGEEDDPTAPTDQTPPTGECGDASAHMVSGNVAVPPSLMCGSRTPSLVPIGTKTTRKYLHNRRRRRRINISVHA
jgi:hypothetical protein